MPPASHDWQKLFDSLNDYTKGEIRVTFRRIISSDLVLSNLDSINPEAVKVVDFDRSLTAAKNTFGKRRYLYEPMPQGEWFYAHLLREAIRTVTKMDVRLAGLE